MLNRSQQLQLQQGARSPAELSQERYARVSSDSVPFVVARIITAVLIPGAVNRWQYGWEIALQNNDAQKTFGEVIGEPWYTGIAFNTMEGMNDSNQVGPGVVVANIPVGFTVKPVSGYVVLFPHRMVDGTERWVFCVPNAIDGECA